MLIVCLVPLIPIPFVYLCFRDTEACSKSLNLLLRPVLVLLILLRQDLKLVSVHASHDALAYIVKVCAAIS